MVYQRKPVLILKFHMFCHFITKTKTSKLEINLKQQKQQNKTLKFRQETRMKIKKLNHCFFEH